MRYALFLLLLTAAVSFPGCEDECDCAGTGNFEYMIFGHFYGECAGEGCVEIFKIENGKLYEDSTDVYPNGTTAYQGQFYALPDAKYQLVKDLVDDFPNELYDETEHVIGMPDAGDWGGIYVEIKHANAPAQSGFWLLDQMESNMPEAYNIFVDQINEKIHLIQE
jgi:hypothetical protein